MAHCKDQSQIKRQMSSSTKGFKYKEHYQNLPKSQLQSIVEESKIMEVVRKYSSGFLNGLSSSNRLIGGCVMDT